jgi:hypothetical protein
LHVITNTKGYFSMLSTMYTIAHFQHIGAIIYRMCFTTALSSTGPQNF